MNKKELKNVNKNRTNSLEIIIGVICCILSVGLFTFFYDYKKFSISDSRAYSTFYSILFFFTLYLIYWLCKLIRLSREDRKRIISSIKELIKRNKL